LDFVTASDPHVGVALWSAFAALAATLVLLAAVLALRVRLLHRLARERDAAAYWIPLIARCTDSRPATLPPLRRRDADDFVLLWCRAMDSLRGQSLENLRDMAHRVGADKHARRMLQSRSHRRRLVATVALGHLHARDLTASLQTEIASSAPMPSLVAAKALIRTNPPAGIRTVLSVAARREDWPLASVATMLKECDSAEVGPALSSAIRLAIARGDDIGVARLLRLHVTAEPDDIRDAVRDSLAACADTEILAAAVTALSHPADIAHARRLLAHPEWFVRVAAARALGRIGDENDVARLTTALRDSSWWVRHRAAQALSQLPGMEPARLSEIADRQTDRFAADMLRQTLAERCAT
jgi:HEAT repeat protein